MNYSDDNAKIVVDLSDGFKLLPVSDIVRFFSDAKYTRLETTDGKLFFVSNKSAGKVVPLKDLEQRSELSHFVRVHRGHLVSRHCINQFIRPEKNGDGGKLVLTTGTQVPLARRHVSMVRRLLRSSGVSV